MAADKLWIIKIGGNIIDDPEANKLITVDYRKPWKLPYMA